MAGKAGSGCGSAAIASRTHTQRVRAPEWFGDGPLMKAVLVARSMVSTDAEAFKKCQIVKDQANGSIKRIARIADEEDATLPESIRELAVVFLTRWEEARMSGAQMAANARLRKLTDGQIARLRKQIEALDLSAPGTGA